MPRYKVDFDESRSWGGQEYPTLTLADSRFLSPAYESASFPERQLWHMLEAARWEIEAKTTANNPSGLERGDPCSDWNMQGPKWLLAHRNASVARRLEWCYGK